MNGISEYQQVLDFHSVESGITFFSIPDNVHKFPVGQYTISIGDKCNNYCFDAIIKRQRYSLKSCDSETATVAKRDCIETKPCDDDLKEGNTSCCGNEIEILPPMKLPEGFTNVN